ncbi:unnamed protein product [Merluccius merluccius]
MATTTTQSTTTTTPPEAGSTAADATAPLTAAEPAAPRTRWTPGTKRRPGERAAPRTGNTTTTTTTPPANTTAPRTAPRTAPSPYRSPRRSGQRSPHRSPHRSPRRRHAHSSDPYRRRSPDGYGSRGNHKPNVQEPVLPEPPRSLDLPYGVLREPGREATLERLYKEDSLLPRASSLERSYRAHTLLRDVSPPRVRTPDSDSAYKKYSSLLRDGSPEREGRPAGRDPFPRLGDRGRSLGRDISPMSSFRREGRADTDDSYDDDDDDDLVAAKVREYYSTLKSEPRRSSAGATLKSDASRSSANANADAALPEPKKKTYKDNPRDLSI